MRYKPPIVAVLTWLIFSSISSFWPAPVVFASAPASLAEEAIYFPETGQYLSGKFRAYWQTRGGLAIFGYPLTPAFYENNYLVQYFERNRFELHPEKAGTPYEVLLGLLGRDRWRAEGRSVSPAAPARPGDTFFPETGYTLGGPFGQYWRKYGGLAQFGFPITPEFEETSGGPLVQYFERARFELHPEFRGSDYYVLLGLLGRDRADRLDPLLRRRWPERLPPVSLELAGGSRVVAALDSLTFRSDQPGELLLLDGANRHYATYSVQVATPLTVPVAGIPGRHSYVLVQQGQPVAARWADFTLAVPSTGLQTGDPIWDGLYPRVKSFLEKDVAVYDSPLDGKPVRGYRSPDTPFIWLRDHVYQSKGFKFFETDLKGTLDYFRATQRPDGSFDDYFQYYRGYDVYKGQIEIEADREFLFVEGVWLAWQATGDDDWLRLNLPAMERGLEHTFSDPRRWSPEFGLVKRSFTIDTWDFEQGSDQDVIRRTFDENTRWSIMHGDSTGAYHSARLLAGLLRYTGQPERARMWDNRADALLENLNRYSWNGQFYTHQLHLTPVDPTGVNEKTQLSLSNAYALNRGTLTQPQAATLLRTYQARRAQNAGKIFAEWYSIDPPFPLGFGPPGEYVNGGVMPLVGGELARGAFEYGFEAYGLDILRRYWELLNRSGGSYLWYHPDGRPGLGTDATLPSDGWGSAAMLNALTEGLAGVVDADRLYRRVNLSPRWAATDRSSVQVTLGYGASGAYFAYRWQYRPGAGLNLRWGGAQTTATRLHLLLPPELPNPTLVLCNDRPLPFAISRVENSYYLDAFLPATGNLEVK